LRIVQTCQQLGEQPCRQILGLKSQAEQQGRAWAFRTVKVLREPQHTVNSASRMKSFRRGLRRL
jgi:hypothetical protein